MSDQAPEGSRQEFLRILADAGQEPAFARRRRRLEAALERMRWGLRTERRELLRGPSLQCRILAALLRRDWSKLASHLAAPSEHRAFQRLHDQLERECPPTTAVQISWFQSVERTLRDLDRSVDRFNRHWEATLRDFSLDEINQTIERYNRNYVLEKAAALGSESLARRGFTPIPEQTIADLRSEFPPLALPRRRGAP